MPRISIALAVCLTSALHAIALQASAAPTEAPFDALDVFDLEYAADPRISPDGDSLVYVRNGFDIRDDRGTRQLWRMDMDGDGHRPLTKGLADANSPRWSPDGERIAYISDREGSSQIWMHWVETGESALMTRLPRAPSELTWSPDGSRLAFTLFVPEDRDEPTVAMPDAPEGAEWAPPARVITRLSYRVDGTGYLDEGFTHVFVTPAEGGAARQLTRGDFDHDGPLAWSPDGTTLYFSANRYPDWDMRPRESELFALDVASGALQQLTDREGPDQNPVVSPDGRLAWLGFDDEKLGYHNSRVHLRTEGGDVRVLGSTLDRSVDSLAWDQDGDGLFIEYDDRGDKRLAYLELEGDLRELPARLGGTTLGRPYTSGGWDAGAGGRVVYTQGAGERPAELVLARLGHPGTRRLTDLNGELVDHRDMARVEARETVSVHDGLPIQYWLALPPGFDPERRYPAILEIHGGPFAAYGPHFSAEVQLYAAAGYVVVWANPRGSTSYGADFANEIHHDYPGDDYDDLMSVMDDVLEDGYVDEERLFVTGGSGGGVLSAWIVGRTDRFRAAVVAKPVINWTSFALTADLPAFFHEYWFADPPWVDPDSYWERSPLSLVGEVSTPTMLLTGEADYRTPISETEQFYTALRLRGVDTAMVRIPDTAHGIAASRPSNLIRKVAHILGWFADHGGEPVDDVMEED